MKTSPRYIGLTGTNASGKGEAAAFFGLHGYQYHSLSDAIREELEKRGLPPTRDNLIRVGNELRESLGADVLAKRIFKKIREKSVIDSIRNPSEIAYLRRQEGFILLSVDAPVELRYQRARLRGRDESAGTLEAFKAKEREEITDRERGQQLRNCMDLADLSVINDGTLEDFHKKLERLL